MTLDPASPSAVVACFREGAEANLQAACRAGSIDVVHAPGRLVASGDLHDNPLHFQALCEVAALEGGDDLTLHEVIHSDRLVHGVDFSHRALLRVADLKRRHPEGVHALLANHELSQIVGAGIVKDGVRVVEAFNDGVEYVFGDESPRVLEAIEAFIRSMPLALRAEGDGVIWCSHTLPEARLMDRFDPTIFDRVPTDEDYVPRQGSAHLMVWGRQHGEEHLRALASAWGVDLFILGHEKAEQGARALPPNAMILNSDHASGACAVLDLALRPTLEEAMMRVRPLGRGFDHG
ncbi:MAG: hypothetical protein KDA28_06040 [Phycisphaerales bacterium]|nr:hypothetical protein [Phycisphaerales bacterium]